MTLTLLSTTVRVVLATALAAALAAAVTSFAAPGTAGAQTPGTVTVMEASRYATISTPQGQCRPAMPTRLTQVGDGSVFTGPIGTAGPCHDFQLTSVLSYRDADPRSGRPTAVEVVATTILHRVSDSVVCDWKHTNTLLTNFRWAPGPGGVPIPQLTETPTITLQGCGVTATFRQSYMHP